MAHDVFISYSHVDYQMANAICHRFEAEGIRCLTRTRIFGAGGSAAEHYAGIKGLFFYRMNVHDAKSNV